MDEQLNAGHKLDALVAKDVMGWRPSKILAGTALERTQYIPPEINGHPDYIKRFARDPLPYSTSATQAFAVVDEMLAQGFWLDLCVRNGGCTAWFYPCESFDTEGAVHADTAPLAICRAALRAIALRDWKVGGEILAAAEKERSND